MSIEVLRETDASLREAQERAQRRVMAPPKVTEMLADAVKLGDQLTKRLGQLSERMLGAPATNGREPEPEAVTGLADQVQAVLIRLRAAQHVVDGLLERL